MFLKFSMPNEAETEKYFIKPNNKTLGWSDYHVQHIVS